jgi:hypothetical protein
MTHSEILSGLMGLIITLTHSQQVMGGENETNFKLFAEGNIAVYATPYRLDLISNE